MLGHSIKCCSRQFGSNAYDLANHNWALKPALGSQWRWYSKDKGECCKNNSQEGRTIEPWPKSDQPPPPWRCECPRESMPYNNDPYRIKVPEIAVPKIPESDAKPQIDCARRGTCTPPAPPPEPCPPPKVKPFSWFYILATTAFLAALGVIYKFWAYNDKLKKSGMFNLPWSPRQKVRKPLYDTDLPECVQYLIIGTGAAGWAAYNAIMENDPKAKVFFITKEDIEPYRRAPMSKFMWWNKLPPDIKTLRYYEQKYKTMYQTSCATFMDPVKFYRLASGPAVSLASGWCVVRIDPENHIAYVKTLCGERPMYYERCLIAVGSKANQLNMFKIAPKKVREKVTTFRTVRDLEDAFRKVRQAKHVTIIGGGALGCELAYSIAKMKEKVEKEDEEKPPLEIVLMYKDGGILGNILPEYLGEWAAEKIKCEGVKMMPKTTPHDAFLSKDGRLQLTLSDGSSLVTDYALVAVGASPRMELAEPSHLEADDVNGGFLVNTELEARTHLYASERGESSSAGGGPLSARSTPLERKRRNVNIFTWSYVNFVLKAGDAASFYSKWKNTRQRFQHLIPAEEQGALAGYNMTGYWEPCNVEQAFWLNLGDAIDMEVVGDVGACMPIIALFKPCRPEDLSSKEPEGELPCYKDSAEYKERYKRGLLCYLRDETIVGFVFWNMPPIEDRKEVATEILRARPHYKDINLVADLLGFPETHCIYLKPEEIVEEGPCIRAYREF